MARLAQTLPEGGKRFITEAQLVPDKLQSRVSTNGSTEVTLLAEPNSPAATARRVVIDTRPPNTWDIGISAPITTAIKKGDSLLMSFWARGQSTDGNSGAVAEFVFEQKGGAYTKSVQHLVETPKDGSWERYLVRFKSKADYAANGAVINFQLGYQTGRIDVCGIEAWNYGERPLKDLPYTPITYVGRGPDGEWRAAAAKRIEQHRKGTLSVILTDAEGKPRTGQEVRVKMERLLFDLGSAVKSEMIMKPDDEAAEKYRQTFRRSFNLGVIENGLKWKQWDSYPVNQKRNLDTLEWMKERNIPMRGHVMVWPGKRYQSEWIHPLLDQPKVLGPVIKSHIREMAYATQGLVRDWDVLNEVYDNRDFTNTLGDEAMVDWFKEAKRVMPKVKCYYNDYAALVRGGFPTGHKDHFEQTLRYLIKNGAPLDGIGIQGHFGSLVTPPHRLLAELDKWGKLGPNILITEFDITVPDRQLQADFTRDFLTTCFSHPKVDGVVTWGFWAGAMWRPESALFDQDWKPTLMGEEWLKLKREWSTDETLVTDANGHVQLHAFLGDYLIETTAGDASVRLRHSKAKTETKLHSKP